MGIRVLDDIIITVTSAPFVTACTRITTYTFPDHWLLLCPFTDDLLLPRWTVILPYLAANSYVSIIIMTPQPPIDHGPTKALNTYANRLGCADNRNIEALIHREKISYFQQCNRRRRRRRSFDLLL